MINLVQQLLHFSIERLNRKKQAIDIFEQIRSIDHFFFVKLDSIFRSKDWFNTGKHVTVVVIFVIYLVVVKK